MNEAQRNLDDISAEITGISKNLHLIGINIREQGSATPETYADSLFGLAEHLRRISAELEFCHMALVAKEMQAGA